MDSARAGPTPYSFSWNVGVDKSIVSLLPEQEFPRTKLSLLVLDSDGRTACQQENFTISRPPLDEPSEELMWPLEAELKCLDCGMTGQAGGGPVFTASPGAPIVMEFDADKGVKPYRFEWEFIETRAFSNNIVTTYSTPTVTHTWLSAGPSGITSGSGSVIVTDGAGSQRKAGFSFWIVE